MNRVSPLDITRSIWLSFWQASLVASLVDELRDQRAGAAARPVGLDRRIRRPKLHSRLALHSPLAPVKGGNPCHHPIVLESGGHFKIRVTLDKRPAAFCSAQLSSGRRMWRD